LFDWEGLAQDGVGLWPPPWQGAVPDAAEAPSLLARIGYRADLPLPVLLTAFQRHWRPARVDGLADAETLARLAAVAEAATRS
jgi:N-acetylmuramoyl-L-alanine amidase